MNIKEVTFSSGNDFMAIFTCPLCKYEFEAWGYSDAYYFDNVMPNAICPKCGKNSHGETEDELEARVGRTYRI